MNGTITDLVPDPRRAGRVAVVVDGRAAGVVALDALELIGARVGARADARFVAALADADAECAVHDQALRLLANRARSTADMKRRLVRTGAEKRHVERTVERLTAAGLLDDAEYARLHARSRVSRGTSARRLRQELAGQGVAADVASEAVDEVFVDEAVDEATLAERTARKRARTLTQLPLPIQRRRLYAYLARRGYDPDAVRRAIEVVLGR